MKIERRVKNDTGLLSAYYVCCAPVSIHPRIWLKRQFLFQCTSTFSLDDVVELTNPCYFLQISPDECRANGCPTRYPTHTWSTEGLLQDFNKRIHSFLLHQAYEIRQKHDHPSKSSKEIIVFSPYILEAAVFNSSDMTTDDAFSTKAGSSSKFK